ncbi:MAG: DUF120 domain-containing protein [Candidatus Micrarchaeia archaeon]|jgi:riboflavin kinase
MEKKTRLELLVLLAQKGGLKHSVEATTLSLAKELGVSQQTASRWMLELGRERKISRTQSGIRLSPAAGLELEGLRAQLEGISQKSGEIFLEGKLVSGFGDGSYYLAQEGYARQFREKLGFEPFPGTLNVLLAGAEDLQARAMLDSREGIPISGFSSRERKFGGAKCFKAEINSKAMGAVIIPQRSHYGNETVEIISPKNLRKTLGLKQGVTVRVKVES